MEAARKQKVCWMEKVVQLGSQQQTLLFEYQANTKDAENDAALK